MTAAALPLTDSNFPAAADNARRRALLAGAGGLGLTLVLALISPKAVLPAYLAAYLFVLGFGVGSLGLLLLHHLVGGTWGFVIRRPLEAAAATLPVLAVLFLPIAVGVKVLYPWADPAVVAESPVIQAKVGYLNVGFWLARAAVYHAVWSGIALLLRRGSVKQDTTTDPAPTEFNQSIAGPCLALVFVSVTFAMIDWGMSIEPDWYSTIYGVMLMVGFALTALAGAVIVSSNLRGLRDLGPVARPDGFHDLGNLMLAFTMLWAYMSFSQYLIIWMGNIAEEVPWYLKRSAGGWRLVVGLLILVHFFLPFFLLLVRSTKRDPGRLWRVAALLLVMHLINDAWLILPAYPGPQWVSLLALVPALAGVGGVSLGVYATLLRSRPLLPTHDPLLAEALAHHNHHNHNHDHDHGGAH